MIGQMFSFVLLLFHDRYEQCVSTSQIFTERLNFQTRRNSPVLEAAQTSGGCALQPFDIEMAVFLRACEGLLPRPVIRCEYHCG